MRVDPGPGDGPAAAVLGGQGTYISLESANVTYEDEIFSADVTVRNLLTQSLGTADGAEVDEEGVRIFFIGDPVAVPAAAGPVTLQNADGTAVFTKPDQPFFRYPQALGPGRTSLPRNWRWQVPDGVDSFTFSVFVAASVAREDSILAGLQIDPQTISGGYEFTCGLTTAGKAYCWGRDNAGQLGTGELENKDKPVAVADPPDGATKYTAIATGSFHTCALTTTGKVYCWGNGEYGQLGNGESGLEAYDSVPVPVVDPTSGAVQFTSITTGNSFTCGATTSGQAYCWGHYSEGQLGVGPGSQHKTRPTEVLDPTDGPAMLIASFDPMSDGDRAGVGGGVNYCGTDGSLARLDKGRSRYTQAPLRRLPLLAYLGEGVGHAHSPRG